VVVLLVKVILTPLLIALASLAQRRWGAAFGGWLVGLPLTSGPISVFFFIQHGPAFTAAAARGTLAGTISEAAFCFAYVATATVTGWAGSCGAASAAFLAATLTLQPITLPLAAWGAAVALVLCVEYWALRPQPSNSTHAPTAAPPRWDLGARAVTATGFVLTLTAASAVLGPRLSGLLSPFPIYAGVMIAFTHLRGGAGEARRAARGVVAGLFAFAAFFIVVAATVTRASPSAAFTAAALAALAVQGVSGRFLRQPADEKRPKRESHDLQ
jgi:hypothetical protein